MAEPSEVGFTSKVVRFSEFHLFQHVRILLLFKHRKEHHLRKLALDADDNLVDDSGVQLIDELFRSYEGFCLEFQFWDLRFDEEAFDLEPIGALFSLSLRALNLSNPSISMNGNINVSAIDT